MASIIAGSGAASDGRYRGVAPGVDLVIGKALDNQGNGTMSQVIEAMEWAVLEQGADVVNLSLGGDPSDGTDPGSQAVNDLSAATGALFVIAAGNDGPSPFTVSTPGAATDALTVGSVDKSDRLAGTSSRGPRLGDHAIKPEITGPGVSITAARAAGTALGTPADERYTTASGTSMATPHVAGAAALLAQQHPDWDATQLKAALVGRPSTAGTPCTSRVPAGSTWPARSGRRCWCPRSPRTSALPWPPSGPPLTRTLTVANHGGTAAVLDLSLTVTTVGGEPVPDGALSLDTDTLTVAAGGTASVTVTLDPASVGSGRYTGRLVAVGADDLTVTAPVGFTVAEPMYTLQVDLPVREGAADFRHINVTVWGVDGSFTGESAQMVCPCPDGAEFVLPAGVYHVLSWVSWTGENGEPHRGGLIDPEVVVTGDTTAVLDANRLSRISIETEQPSEPFAASFVAVFRASADGSRRLISTLGSQSLDWWLTPTEPVTMGEFVTGSHWLLTEPVADGNPGYVYQLKLYEDDRVPASLHYRFDDLARVDNVLHADQPDTPMRLTWFRWRPVEFAAGGVLQLTGPTTLREYVGPLSAVDTHDRRLAVTPPVGFFPENALHVFDRPATYRTHWNARPFVPGAVTLPEQVSQSELTVPFPLWVCAGCRQGDMLYPFVHRTSREPQHTLGRFATTFDDAFGLATVRLFRDGVEVPQAPPFFGAVTTYELPPEPARYVLTLDTADTFTEWEFESATVTEDAAPPGYLCPETGFGFTTTPCAPQPLIFLRYDVDVDALNTMPAPGAHEVEVTVYRQAAGAPPVTGLRLWYSTDGGQTWEPGKGLRRSGDTFTAMVVAPRLDGGSGTVALRVEAWDADGNRVEQTVLDAYGLRDRTGG